MVVVVYDGDSALLRCDQVEMLFRWESGMWVLMMQYRGLTSRGRTMYNKAEAGETVG